MFIEAMSAYESRDLLINLAIACFTAAGLTGVVFAVYAQRKDHRIRRNQATLEFYSETMQGRHSFRQQFPDDRNKGAVASFLSGATDQDGARSRLLSEYLNYYEMLATGVNLGVYDLGVIDHLAGPRIVKAYLYYAPWIGERRKHFRERTLYAEWRQLCEGIVLLRTTRPLRDREEDLATWATRFDVLAIRAEAGRLPRFEPRPTRMTATI